MNARVKVGRPCLEKDADPLEAGMPDASSGRVETVGGV